MLGPESFVLKKLFRTNPGLRQHMDYNLYCSLVRLDNNTVDLQFEKRSDLIDFVVSFCELASRKNDAFFKVTNRQLISKYLINIKVLQIAHDKGLSISQLICLAIFTTESKNALDAPANERKELLYRLAFLIRFCRRKSIPLKLLDLKAYELLKDAFYKGELVV